MALRKETLTKYGITGEYWRVAQTNIDWTDMHVHIDILLYIDQDVRIAGNDPVDVMSFDVDMTPYIGLEVGAAYNIAAIVYGIIKTIPFFQDAEDVLETGQQMLNLEDMAENDTSNISNISNIEEKNDDKIFN